MPSLCTRRVYALDQIIEKSDLRVKNVEKETHVPKWLGCDSKIQDTVPWAQRGMKTAAEPGHQN